MAPRKKPVTKKAAVDKKGVKAKQGPESVPPQVPKAKVPSPLDIDATPVLKEKSSVFSMRATKLFTPMEPEDKKAAAVEGRLQRAEKRRRINTKEEQDEDDNTIPPKNRKKLVPKKAKEAASSSSSPPTTSDDDIYPDDKPTSTTTKDGIKLLTRKELNTSASEAAAKLKSKREEKRVTRPKVDAELIGTGNTKKAVKIPTVPEPKPKPAKNKKKDKENEDFSNSSHITLLSPQIEYQCEECGQFFLHLRGLRRHVKSKHGEDQSRFPCPKCDAVMSRKDVLDRHLYRKHPTIIKPLNNEWA